MLVWVIVGEMMFNRSLKTSLEIVSPEDMVRAFVNAIEKQEQLSKRIFNLGGDKIHIKLRPDKIEPGKYLLFNIIQFIEPKNPSLIRFFDSVFLNN